MRDFKRKRNCHPQYRLRLASGRCLTYYEVGQQRGKTRRTDLRLAIYGNLTHAEHYRDRYNAEWAWLGLKAEIWTYFGSTPKERVDETQY